MGSLYGFEVESELPLRRLNRAPGERGTLRVEGRDYVIADGDVIHIRFTP